MYSPESNHCYDGEYQSYHRDNGICNTECFQGPVEYTFSSSCIDILHNVQGSTHKYCMHIRIVCKKLLWLLCNYNLWNDLCKHTTKMAKFVRWLHSQVISPVSSSTSTLQPSLVQFPWSAVKENWIFSCYTVASSIATHYIYRWDVCLLWKCVILPHRIA